MRKTMLFLSVFTLAASLWAADPLTGTWKLNTSKSKYKAGSPNSKKEQLIVVREAGDLFEVTETGIKNDGARIAAQFRFPQKGGALMAPAEPLNDQVPVPQGAYFVATVIEPGDLYTTHLQDERQVLVVHLEVAKDGKTMRISIRGLDSGSKPYEDLEFYERQ
jgi:hypothetical protein